jgi:hypothetical protein
MTDESAKPSGWVKPVVLGSVAVLALALVAALVFPRARTAIAAGVLISPIPPIP